MLNNKINLNVFKKLGLEQTAGIEQQTNQAPSGNIIFSILYFIIIRNNI